RGGGCPKSVEGEWDADHGDDQAPADHGGDGVLELPGPVSVDALTDLSDGGDECGERVPFTDHARDRLHAGDRDERAGEEGQREDHGESQTLHSVGVPYEQTQ